MKYIFTGVENDRTITGESTPELLRNIRQGILLALYADGVITQMQLHKTMEYLSKRDPK